MPVSGGLQHPLELPWPVDGPCSDAPSVAWCSPVLAHQQSLVRGVTQTPSPPACGAPSQTSVPPVCNLLLHSTLALLSYRPTVPGADAGPSLSDAYWSRWQVGLPVCGWTAQPFHHFVGGGEWFLYSSPTTAGTSHWTIDSQSSAPGHYEVCPEPRTGRTSHPLVAAPMWKHSDLAPHTPLATS